MESKCANTLKWEIIIPIHNYQYTERLKVFGGWIVRTGDVVKNIATQCFIPDVNHEWNPFFNERLNDDMPVL